MQQPRQTGVCRCCLSKGRPFLLHTHRPMCARLPQASDRPAAPRGLLAARLINREPHCGSISCDQGVPLWPSATAARYQLHSACGYKSARAAAARRTQTGQTSRSAASKPANGPRNLERWPANSLAMRPCTTRHACSVAAAPAGRHCVRRPAVRRNEKLAP
jgi:hypothetical protein